MAQPQPQPKKNTRTPVQLPLNYVCCGHETSEKGCRKYEETTYKMYLLLLPHLAYPVYLVPASHSTKDRVIVNFFGTSRVGHNVISGTTGTSRRLRHTYGRALVLHSSFIASERWVWMTINTDQWLLGGILSKRLEFMKTMRLKCPVHSVWNSHVTGSVTRFHISLHQT